MTGKKPEKLCDKYCSDCLHYRELYCNTTKGVQKVCHYILDTNQKRPCSAGTGCDVYKKRTKEDILKLKTRPILYHN